MSTESIVRRLADLTPIAVKRLKSLHTSTPRSTHDSAHQCPHQKYELGPQLPQTYSLPLDRLNGRPGPSARFVFLTLNFPFELIQLLFMHRLLLELPLVLPECGTTVLVP